MVNRRAFLSSFAGMAALGSAGIPPSPEVCHDILAQFPDKLPDRALYDSNEEAYWTEVRKLFLIPDDEVYLNNGTVGSSPVPVLRAVFEGYRDSERLAQADPEDYPIWGYAAWNQFRDPLAEFIGCKRDELALVRNATEANSFIANGLDLKAGDEVVITDQEHPGGEHPWNLRAKRYGIVVKKVTLPRPVPDNVTVLNLFNDSITPRTRVFFFSHITTVTGVVLPVKELAALARSKGILSAVDGAHVPGMMKLDVHELGCDLYSASPHKWLQSPKGTGFLYVRDEVIDRVWNTIATEGWDDTKIRAERFQQLQRARALRPESLHRICKSDRSRPHRETPPQNGRLHSHGNGRSWRGFLDFAQSHAALRHRHDHHRSLHHAGAGNVDVETKEDSHSRWPAFQGAPLDSLLFAQKGYRSLPRRRRRIPRHAPRLAALS
jgi:isopenicillin-N epimerase